MDFFHYFLKGTAALGQGKKRRNPKKIQKISRYSLGVLGVSAVVIGVFGLRNQVLSPFTFKAAVDHVVEASGDRSSFDAGKDSDGDGISDFQEAYFYHTNPYLADSDGDGIPDGEEIRRASDPNCPQGKVCNTESSGSGGAGRVPAESKQDTAATNPGQDGASSQPLSPPGEVDIGSLRQSLIQQGADPAMLQSVDDATLKQAYAESYNETKAYQPAQSAQGEAPQSAAQNQQGLSSLTPREIRDFLKSGGGDEQTLNAIDDATLKSIFSEALKNESVQGPNAGINANP